MVHVSSLMYDKGTKFGKDAVRIVSHCIVLYRILSHSIVLYSFTVGSLLNKQNDEGMNDGQPVCSLRPNDILVTV